jgi:predicted RNA binding protein YcfA (HicA-like mRNA interferase family)
MKAEKHNEDTQQPIVDLESYDQHENLIAVIMARFFLRYLNLLYREFKGDLVLPIVLGEIAHHNIFRLYSLKGDSMEVNEQAANDPERMKHLEPTNAFSISQATRIPRETVRRKIEKLQQKGWVVKNDRGQVCISETVSGHFTKELNKKILAELLKTSESIRNLLKPA